ncbi:MAG: ATP-binding protein [Chloroflexi bacterium]|nr:ATP-binding protein [Chloroflexota bacterium]
MLVGIILIGRKFNSRPYSQEDEHLISTLTRRLGPELDNARLYAIETGIRKDLEEQNRLKTDFLNKVAQELKIPLTNIIKSSESLNGYQKSKLNIKERLLTRNIQRGAWWLDRRVSELIDFASSKSNMIKLDIKPLNTRDLIINTTSQLEYIFINKEQNLHIDIEQDLPLILGDYDKLQQILFNLLSNANKYSPAGSKISVGAHNNSGSIVIEIGDSASIISDDEKTRIFEPYYRTKDENIRQNIPGLGLGLTISKKLIELQHGEINIRNNSSGNIFSVKIPIYNNQSDGKEE